MNGSLVKFEDGFTAVTSRNAIRPQNADRCERTIMKAISLWQPWASLIACGAKPYETGSFCAAGLANRSIDAIHAAKKINKGAAQFAEELMYG